MREIIKRVEFTGAGLDVGIFHELCAGDPWQVCWDVMQQSAAGSIYQDTTVTRRAWGRDVAFLRASAPMVANIRLYLPDTVVEPLIPVF